MSMPTFPESVLKLSREQVLHMLLGSIAMEELALSHIMNAEGEKLQYLLGTLPGSPPACTTAAELLAVNSSIRELLEHINQSQLLLKGKLSQVLEALAAPAPPEPPCWPSRPCALSAAEVASWTRNCRLRWQPLCPSTCASCWTVAHPAQIQIPAGQATMADYSLSLCPTEAGVVSVGIYCQQEGRCREVSRIEGSAVGAAEPLTLSGRLALPVSAVASSLFFLLRRPGVIPLQQGSLVVSFL